MSQIAITIIREVKEKRLTRLDLGNCGLTELPPEALDCDWVEELILSNSWWEYDAEKQASIQQFSQNKGEANALKSLPSTQPFFPLLTNSTLALWKKIYEIHYGYVFGNYTAAFFKHTFHFK